MMFSYDVHPRVFWDAGEVAALRAKAVHPHLAALRSEVLARCAGYANPADPSFIDTSLKRTALVGETWGCGNTWQKIPDLLLAAILTDDAEWPRLLGEILRVFTQDPSPLNAYIFSHAPKTGHDISLLDGGSQKNLNSQCGMIPLMLDLLWQRLPAADRDAACAYLNREIVEPYLNYMLDDPRDPGFQQGLGINLGWWEFYSWLWSLAVVYDHDDPRHRRGLEAALRRVRLGIHLSTDAAGIIGEGNGYGCIEMYNWWTGAEVFRRFGLADLWQEDERFLAVMKARLYYQWPNDAGLLEHGDTDRGTNHPAVCHLHSLRTGDPVYQAAWERLARSHNPARLYPASPHSPLGVLGFWLWYNPEINPETCRPADWPLAAATGDYGLHMVRSGWGRDACYFAFFTAGRLPGTIIHQHSDAGHFALAAHGEIFCSSRGYGHSLAKYHNVLMVAGKEPPDCAASANAQSFYGGHTLVSAQTDLGYYAVADLGNQWRCKWYHRHALQVRLPGTAPFVVILDNCNKDNDFTTYDWLFQVETGQRAELRPAGPEAVIYGKQARLEMAWACLNANEYPKPSTLELGTATHQHIYAAAQADHPHKALTEYECLKVHLSSYCGVMLAALVPRRATAAPVSFTRHYAPRQTSLVIDHGEVIDTVVANPLTRHLSIGGLTAEASLAVVRRDRQGSLLAVCAGDCFEMVVGGRMIMPNRGRQVPLFSAVF